MPGLIRIPRLAAITIALSGTCQSPHAAAHPGPEAAAIAALLSAILSATAGGTVIAERFLERVRSSSSVGVRARGAVAAAGHEVVVGEGFGALAAAVEECGGSVGVRVCT